MKLSISLVGVALALCTAAPLTAQTLAAWEAPVKVVAADGALTKSAGCEGCPDAGAHSVAQLTGDGYAEFIPAANSRIIAGLGTDLSAATSSSTIDYAFSLWPGGAWEVRERGVYRTDGASAAGDRFRVSVESGRVVYRRNGAVVYTSTVAPTYPLVLDVTLYSLTASLAEAAVVITSTEPVILASAPTTQPSGPPAIAAVGPYVAAIDRFPHAEPALPALGPAGTTIVDPVFTSVITRVTDGSTRPDSPDRSYKTPSSPHQNAWSATGSRFYVVGAGGAVLPYDFDRLTGTASRIQASAAGAGGLVLNFYIEPQFSYLRDSLTYGSLVGGSLRTIDQYDFTTATYSRLLDLDALVPGLAGTYIGGVASSAGTTERVLAMFGGIHQDLHHYAVVFDAANPQTRQVLDTKASTLNGSPLGTPLDFMLHHVMIDRSGRYVMLYPTGADQAGTRKAPQSVLWDTQSSLFTEMPVSSLPYGHDAFGYGVSVNKDCCTSTSYDAGQWQFRSLASPLVTRDVITTVLSPKEVYLSDHPTWNNARPDNSAPFISGLYRHGTNTVEWRAWDDEIVAVQTDAAPGADPTVWRFAHHRSNVANDLDAAATSFWYMPRPNVSPDGQWVLFTSNWEKTLGVDPAGDPGAGARQDVFLVALKPNIRVTTAALPAGRERVIYDATQQAAGGSGVFTWSIVSGQLPAGLGLSPTTGTISGKPTLAGSYTVTVAAADAANPAHVGTTTYAIQIAPGATITSPRVIPIATRDVPYAYAVQAANLEGSVKWDLAGGAMPPGMTLDPATGVISGICTTAGIWYFNARVRDASTDDTLTLTLQVQ